MLCYHSVEIVYMYFSWVPFPFRAGTGEGVPWQGLGLMLSVPSGLGLVPSVPSELWLCGSLQGQGCFPLLTDWATQSWAEDAQSWREGRAGQLFQLFQLLFWGSEQGCDQGQHKCKQSFSIQLCLGRLHSRTQPCSLFVTSLWSVIKFSLNGCLWLL